MLLHPAGRTPESAIKALDADYRQYRLLENQLLQKRARLVGKLPEIQKAKNAVEMLTKKAADQEEVRRLRLEPWQADVRALVPGWGWGPV